MNSLKLSVVHREFIPIIMGKNIICVTKQYDYIKLKIGNLTFFCKKIVTMAKVFFLNIIILYKICMNCSDIYS